jgi:hypothetical protein
MPARLRTEVNIWDVVTEGTRKKLVRSGTVKMQALGGSAVFEEVRRFDKERSLYLWDGCVRMCDSEPVFFVAELADGINSITDNQQLFQEWEIEILEDTEAETAPGKIERLPVIRVWYVAPN